MFFFDISKRVRLVFSSALFFCVKKEPIPRLQTHMFSVCVLFSTFGRSHNSTGTSKYLKNTKILQLSLVETIITSLLMLNVFFFFYIMQFLSAIVLALCQVSTDSWQIAGCLKQTCFPFIAPQPESSWRIFSGRYSTLDISCSGILEWRSRREIFGRGASGLNSLDTLRSFLFLLSQRLHLLPLLSSSSAKILRIIWEGRECAVSRFKVFSQSSAAGKLFTPSRGQRSDRNYTSPRNFFSIFYQQLLSYNLNAWLSIFSVTVAHLTVWFEFVW